MKKILFLIKFFCKVKKLEDSTPILLGLNISLLKSDIANAFMTEIINFDEASRLYKILNDLNSKIIS